MTMGDYKVICEAIVFSGALHQGDWAEPCSVQHRCLIDLPHLETIEVVWV